MKRKLCYAEIIFGALILIWTIVEAIVFKYYAMVMISVIASCFIISNGLIRLSKYKKQVK